MTTEVASLPPRMKNICVAHQSVSLKCCTIFKTNDTRGTVQNIYPTKGLSDVNVFASEKGSLTPDTKDGWNLITPVVTNTKQTHKQIPLKPVRPINPHPA